MKEFTVSPGKIFIPAILVAVSVFAAIEGPSSVARSGNPEDSLQALVQQQPENPDHWIGLGQLALKTDDDLAKGYFDEAIRISKSSAGPIVRIGFLWLEHGKAETSLPYLIPNLTHLSMDQLTKLENALMDRNHKSAAILVLRHHASRTKGFPPMASRAADLAFLSGSYALCRDLLAPHVSQLDSLSARRFLLSAFYAGGALKPEAIKAAAGRSPHVEVKVLAALNFAAAGDFNSMRTYRDAVPTASMPDPIRSYLQAQEMAAEDNTEEAVEDFEAALSTAWAEFRVIALAELYRHFSITGNRYKADQLWESLKERDTLPVLREFLAYRLTLHTYEKQAKYIYKSLYRTYPGRPGVLNALWDDLVESDPSGLGDQVRKLITSDPLGCEANMLAMKFFKFKEQNKDMVRYGRNVVLYCSDIVDPYFDLATALLTLSKPQEARTYFGKYVQHGGDKSRIPTYMR